MTRSELWKNPRVDWFSIFVTSSIRNKLQTFDWLPFLSEDENVGGFYQLSLGMIVIGYQK